MAVAGCLGPGRLVVLPPVVNAQETEVDVLTFGCASWWCSAFTRIGREALAIVHATPSGTPLFHPRPPTDSEIRDTVLHPEVDGRLAFVAEYSKRPAEPIVLVRGRLLEVRRGLPTRPLGEWTFQRSRDADEDLAGAVHHLFDRAAVRMGLHSEFRNWRDAFQSTTAGPVIHVLRALGLCDLAARGFGLRAGPAGLRALVSALRLAPNMGPAIELLPILMDLAVREPSVDDVAVATAWRDARTAVGGRIPPTWARVPELLRRRTTLRGDAAIAE